MTRVDRALDLAASLAGTPWAPVAPAGRPARRALAIGDPQTTDARFFEVLDAHGLLGDDGRLAPDAALLSIGDHFDFAPQVAGLTVEGSGAHGLRILRWLAEHPPDRALIVWGNHDLCRVMELHDVDDSTFARARALALEADAATAEGPAHARLAAELQRVAPRVRARPAGAPPDPARRAALEAELARLVPGLPTTECAVRDWSGFAADQRALVQRLLLAGRGRLAVAGALPDGRELLLTHAGVCDRELDLLGAAGARGAAAALEGHLAAAVERVRAAWEAGRPAPLDLEPLHVAGRAGAEGGGLLYHRPVNPAKGSRGLRRFDVRTLPPGLVQACGHSTNKKMIESLAGLDTAGAEALPPGALRAVVVHPDGRVVYGGADAAQPPGSAVLLMIDGAINSSTLPAERYELLALASLD